MAMYSACSIFSSLAMRPDLVVLDRDDRGIDAGDGKQGVDERELLGVRRDGLELAA